MGSDIPQGFINFRPGRGFYVSNGPDAFTPRERPPRRIARRAHARKLKRGR